MTDAEWARAHRGQEVEITSNRDAENWRCYVAGTRGRVIGIHRATGTFLVEWSMDPCDRHHNTAAYGAGYEMFEELAPFCSSRRYTQALVKLVAPPVDLARYPHKCGRCGRPAYVGFVKTECSAGCQP